MADIGDWQKKVPAKLADFTGMLHLVMVDQLLWGSSSHAILCDFL